MQQAELMPQFADYIPKAAPRIIPAFRLTRAADLAGDRQTARLTRRSAFVRLAPPRRRLRSRAVNGAPLVTWSTISSASARLRTRSITTGSSRGDNTTTAPSHTSRHGSSTSVHDATQLALNGPEPVRPPTVLAGTQPDLGCS